MKTSRKWKKFSDCIGRIVEPCREKNLPVLTDNLKPLDCGSFSFELLLLFNRRNNLNCTATVPSMILPVARSYKEQRTSWTEMSTS